MKILKKLLFAVITVSLSACGNAQQPNFSERQLKSIVSEMNHECPKYLGGWMTLSSIEYDKKIVSVTCDISSGPIKIENFKNNSEEIRNNILVSYANDSSEDFKKFILAIVDANACLDVKYRDNDNNVYTFHFSTEEINSNIANNNISAEKRLAAIVASTKKQLPTPIDDGLIASDHYLDKQYLYNIIICDESIYNINLFEENKSTIKEQFLLSFINNPMAEDEIKLLKGTNRGIIYKFVGSYSGKVYIISIESEEL